MTKNRDPRLDNLRCLLIYTVVFCHLMVELSHGQVTGALYQLIYVFHMPAFVLVTGYFARWRPGRVVRTFLVPYLVLQLTTFAFRNAVAGRPLWTGVTFVQPQWTLWYLLACAFWYLSVPALERVRHRAHRVLVCAAALVLSVAVGFVPGIGAVLDLSRILVLYPFFCIGFYAGKERLSQRLASLDAKATRRLQVTCALAVLACMTLHYLHGTVPKNVLYRDMAYRSPWEAEARVILQLAALAWCALLFVTAPARDLGRISEAGRNTLSVYLLHPWLIRALRPLTPLPGGEVLQLGACAVLSALMLVLLGNDAVGGALRLATGGRRAGASGRPRG